MSLTGFLVVECEPCGRAALTMEGNGRSAREEGNEGFLRGTMRFASPCALGEVASGEDTIGRDMVMEAKANVNGECYTRAQERTH